MDQSESAGLVFRPGPLIDEDDSFVVEDELFDGLCDSRAGEGRYSLLINIVEVVVAGVGVLAAGDGPNAVSGSHQPLHDAHVLGSVVFDELEVGV
jgi:hypothetical protein